MPFDVHSHLQFPQYDHDRDEVIARMRAVGVKTITVGTDIETSKKAIVLAEQYPEDMWATIGIHPTDTESLKVSEFKMFKELATHPKVVAIGECGLDYYRLHNENREEQIKKQKELFEWHIELAEQVNKPLMIHCRPSKKTDDAYEDLLAILKTKNSKLKTIVHFFVGSTVVAKQFLELDCVFTFGGVITFARDYDEVIRLIPLENILLETDAPFVAPEAYRGKRNEPAYVVETAKKVAEIKGISLDDVFRVTKENARGIFDITAII